MIEKTAISLIVAFTTLLQDAMSCPREICVRPDGDVVYYNDLEESIIYDHNYTGSSAEYPVIPIGHDGVITLSECKCQSNFCMRKCCSLNSTMDALTGRCMDDEIVTVNGKRWKKSWFHRDLPCFGTCPAGKKLHIAPLRDGMHFSFISGYLCMDDEHFHMCFNLDQFCIDYVSSPKGSAIASCIKETEKLGPNHGKASFIRNMAIIHQLVHVTHLISILSLTVTFLVYSCFHELRNIHGKCLLCHLASYIIHYVLLISMNSVDDEGRLATEELCQVLDTADFYFSLAPFSWMNVICFDILMSFRNLRPRHGNSRKAEWKKFSLYSLYSWTTPILAVVTCSVVDANLPLFSYSLVHHTDWCGFSGYVILRCRIYPISVYLGISGVLFVMTAVKIYQINASTSILRREERIQRSEENGNEHSFKIYAKLLVLMGFISWVMEPIHYAASQGTHSYFKFEYYYINTYISIGILKDLQGLYLMVFLLWNNKVINLVKEQALKSRAIIIQHCFPQPQTVQPPSLPESSSQVSRSPLRSVVTVTKFPGGQGSLSESGYIVSENRENASEFNVLTGKPVEDTPSPSVWGSSCPSSIPVGDTNLQVSFSTASCSHEITHL